MADQKQVVLSKRLTIEIALNDLDARDKLMGALLDKCSSRFRSIDPLYVGGDKCQGVMIIEFFDENSLGVEAFVCKWCEENGIAVDGAKKSWLQRIKDWFKSLFTHREELPE